MEIDLATKRIIAVDDQSSDLTDLRKFITSFHPHNFRVFRWGFGDAVRKTVDECVTYSPDVLVLDLNLVGSHRDYVRVLREFKRKAEVLKRKPLAGVDIIIWSKFLRVGKDDLVRDASRFFGVGARSVRACTKPAFLPNPVPPIKFPGKINFWDSQSNTYVQ
jgi:hypothetical protein